ncbi:MAG TPA: zinc-dependent metalloprotease [Fimbriimonadaceae bacterium]|jgi:hypothetical protein
MKRTYLSLALAAVLSVTALTPAHAQDKDKKHGKTPAAAQKQDTKPDATKADVPKKDPKIEEYEHEIKDLKKHVGAFTIYERKKDILLELPEDKLNQLFLVQASLNTGVNSQGLQAGDPVGMFGVDAFKWVRQDDALWLVRPNERFRWSASDPLSVAADRSFPTATLGSFRIEATDPEKKLLLVNITQLFYGDVFKLNEMVGAALGGPYMLDREKSWPASVSSFPNNSVIQMQLNFLSARGPEMSNPFGELFGMQAIPDQLEDPRSAPLKVDFNMWYRKDDGYKPRLADPRVGYFTQDFYNVDKFMDEDRTERYIMRFNLQKKDPKAALSDPVKPIVWIIDPSIPPQYRDAVKDGLLRWNKAFEALGYKNAVQVQDPPKDGTYDHADGRYNVVRWTMSEDSPYAVTWFRTDPFTGEILNASITFDANMLAYAVQEHENMALPVAMQSQTRKPLDIVLRDPKRTLNDDTYLWATDQELLKKQAEERMRQYGFGSLECEYGTGLAENASFALNALVATGGLKIDKQAYAKEFISDTICHEAGHSLGLRHNFMGSTNLTTSQLGDDGITSQQGISASVMDYVPVNVMAVLKGSGNFYSPTIGPYDEWAIKYGYTDLAGSTPRSEVPTLQKIADLSGQHGLGFETDENSDNWDPFVVEFDSGSDPLNYAAKMLEASHKVMDYAVDVLPLQGQGYSKRTDMILSSIMQDFSQGRVAARFVGGIHADRNYNGDKDQQNTLAPVNANDQRTAIHLIAKNLLSSEAFNLPESVVMNFSLDPNTNSSSQWTAPLRQIISSQQERMLAQLMSASTTDRVCENEFKWGKVKGAYTIDEHYGLLLSTVFSEVGKNVSISPTRRDLQRFMVNVLMIQAGAPPQGINDDVREICGDSLRRLSARFGEQLQHTKTLDDMTQVHLRDTKESIDKFLARQEIYLGSEKG